MNNDGMEDLSILQPIVDEVYNGRTEGHKCPYCGKGDLVCEVDEFHLRIECPMCGKFLEGEFLV